VRRGNIDDAPPFAVAHPGQSRLRRVESSRQIERDDLVPLISGKTLQGRDELHTSVIDQNINRTKSLSDARHEFCNFRDNRKICAMVHDFDAVSGFQSCLKSIDLGRKTKTVERDLTACRRETFRNVPAQPARRSGNKSGFSR